MPIELPDPASTIPENLKAAFRNTWPDAEGAGDACSQVLRDVAQLCEHFEVYSPLSNSVRRKALMSVEGSVGRLQKKLHEIPLAVRIELEEKAGPIFGQMLFVPPGAKLVDRLARLAAASLQLAAEKPESAPRHVVGRLIYKSAISAWYRLYGGWPTFSQSATTSKWPSAWSYELRRCAAHLLPDPNQSVEISGHTFIATLRAMKLEFGTQVENSDD